MYGESGSMMWHDESEGITLCCVVVGVLRMRCHQSAGFLGNCQIMKIIIKRQ